jgi:Protein of unknown function (DUF3263)
MGGMSLVASVASISELSARDAELLDFEASWWAASGPKEAEIRERFDLSAPRYYQILNQLLDDPAALAHSPLLVKRLRRLRLQHRENRSARHLTVSATV